MTLSLFMTATATTKRRGVPDATTGKTGDHVTYLEDVKVMPVQAPSATGRQRASTVSGMEGVSAYQYETYTESHTHTQESVSVTELPDIRPNDLITIDSVEYTVMTAIPDTATSSFGETLYIYLNGNNA